MIEADRADNSRAKLDHDLIVPITIFGHGDSILTPTPRHENQRKRYKM